jgi:hypothetical protein
VNNKDDCLKLHHVGYLINRVMMDGTANIKLKGQFGGLQAALDLPAQIVGNAQPRDSLRLSAVVKQLRTSSGFRVSEFILHFAAASCVGRQSGPFLLKFVVLYK